MNDLLIITPSEISNSIIDTVNARDLHSFLGVGRDYTTWIRQRIKTYGFVEGVDYVLPRYGEKSTGRPTIDFAISLDMAKELSMVEKTAKGREARKYFIDCERVAKDNPAINHPLPETLQCQLMGIEFARKNLKISDASTAELMHKVYKEHGLPTTGLIEYVPTESAKFSATDLLKRFDSFFKIRDFNKRMIELGYLEEKERTGSKSKIKKFKALTEAGLKWGVNETSPHNKLEVQPRYFEDSFGVLFDEIVKINA